MARRRLPIGAVLLPAIAALLLAGAACGGGDQIELSAFCEKLSAAAAPEGALASLTPSDPDAAEVAAEELDRLHRAAPLEIKPSLAVVNDTVSLVLAAFSDSEVSGQDSLQRMDAEMSAYAEAATELARFAADHCGLELNPETPSIVFDSDRIRASPRA